MQQIVGDEGFQVACASTRAAARAWLDEHSAPAVMLVDLSLPDGSGLDLLRGPNGEVLESDVIVITGHATVETVVRALRHGAADYLTKPVDVDRLVSILRDVRIRLAASTHGAESLDQARSTGRFHRIIGASSGMLSVYRQITRVAPTDATVLIQGDTGTGKELVAETIHELSRRSEQPFVALNCGAVSGTLIESELFGHEKGSFTGAAKRHLGVFERAKGGTLFLDEVTEMPAELQVKLLRVLETRVFTRVGGEEQIASDARVLTATNRDPARAVRDGKLREDLFYRLWVFPITLPRLRDREGDVERLAREFLHEANVAHGIEKTLADGAIEWLVSQSWPGNVRELKNRITCGWIMSDDVIEASAMADTIECEATEIVPKSLDITIGMSIAEAEKELILATIASCNGNKNVAARVLGISVKTLYSRLSVYTASASSTPSSEASTNESASG